MLEKTFNSIIKFILQDSRNIKLVVRRFPEKWLF